MQRHWPVLHVEAPIWAGSKEICIRKFLHCTGHFVQLCALCEHNYELFQFAFKSCVHNLCMAVWMSWGTVHMYTSVYFLHNCAHFLHWFVHCQCTPLYVHFAQLCTVLCIGRGRGRDAALLHPPATRQLETILWNICTFIGGDVTEARQPGWMGLQRRIFSVGANLPKHWKDGRWVITDQFARWWSAWKACSSW